MTMLIDLLACNAGKLIREGDGFLIAHRRQREPIEIPASTSCYLPYWITLSPGSRNAICAAGGDIIHAGRSSAHWQSTRGPQARYVERRRKQYRALENTACSLSWAKHIIALKISGQIETLRSWWRRHTAFDWRSIMARLKKAQLRLPACCDVDHARALEGEAAAAYFQAWRELLKEPDFRRRPRDRACPVNLLADLYYAHLTSVIDGHLRCAGYDPCYGVLHPPRNDRPSLALDLIEPLRPRLADKLILNLATSTNLTTWMEQLPDQTWTFAPEGRRKAMGRWKTWFYGGKRRPGQKRWLDHIIAIWQDWLHDPTQAPRPW